MALRLGRWDFAALVPWLSTDCGLGYKGLGFSL